MFGDILTRSVVGEVRVQYGQVVGRRDLHSTGTSRRRSLRRRIISRPKQWQSRNSLSGKPGTIQTEIPIAIPNLDRRRRARLVQILDLFGEDSWRSVYAGELEVRPPSCAHHSTLSRPAEPKKAILG